MESSSDGATVECPLSGPRYGRTGSRIDTLYCCCTDALAVQFFRVQLRIFAADKEDHLLSNELFVTLPLDTENIVLPAEAGRPQGRRDEAEDRQEALLPADGNLNDMYKEVLKILPGSPHEGTTILVHSPLSVNVIILYLN